MNVKSLSIALLFVLAIAPNSHAQDNNANNNEFKIDDYYIDFAVPDLSAFALLGINSNLISRPGNIKELSASLLQIADKSGKISPGIAIEWCPAKTFPPKTLSDYQKGKLFRALTISIATVKDSSATRIGFGFKWTPIDRSDPLLDEQLERKVLDLFESYDLSKPSKINRGDFIDRTKSFLLELLPDSLDLAEKAQRINPILSLIEPQGNTPPPDPLNINAAYKRVEKKLEEMKIPISEEQKVTLHMLVHEYVEIIYEIQREMEDRTKAIEKGIKEVKTEFKKKSWNATVIQIALGTTWQSLNSTWKDLESDKFSTFGGIALPFTNRGQLILHAQYMRSYNNDSSEKWKYSVGARMLFGNSDIRWSIEGIWSETESSIAELDKKYNRVTTGFEFKLSNGLWLELAIGGNYAIEEGSKAEMISLANLKYAVRKDRRFDIP